MLLAFSSNSSGSQSFSIMPLDQVSISKLYSNSYSIVDGTAYIKPFFDTTYVISGSSSALNSSKSLINSTIINDFASSPTIGYIVQVSNDSSSNANLPKTLPSLQNPFVSIENVSDNISSQLTAALSSAISANMSDINLKCIFGDSIGKWKCDVYSLPL